MEREKLQSLRPKIPTIHIENNTSSAESFQNITLRPIIKFQNRLLIKIFDNYIQTRKGEFYKLNNFQKEEYINNAIKKDQKLNQLILGTIIGHFTLKEWNEFLFDERELKKRISNMIIQRLQNQIDKLSI